MHRKQILGALVILFFGVVAAATMPAPTAVSDSGPRTAPKSTVSPEFDNQVNDMIFAMKKVKDPVKRYAVFTERFKKLSQWRAAHKQSESKEISMSLFMDTLSFLPAKKDFKYKNCPDYRKKAASMRSFKDGSPDPEVESALEVVRVICQ